MVDPKAVRIFFDRLAPQWDADMIRDDAVIDRILDNARVTAGTRVLDVACGTGVLIPDYLKRNTASVTAIDLSPEMVRIARQKFPEPNVTILCGDVEQTRFDDRFDRIVVYNALPHFADVRRLIRTLSALLESGGVLTVAHGMSREAINRHHQCTGSAISDELMPIETLAAIVRESLTVTAAISDARMYQAVGIKQ